MKKKNISLDEALDLTETTMEQYVSWITLLSERMSA
jgi:hypothetical protein